MAESLPRDELLERLTIAVDPSADPSRDPAVLAGYRQRFSLVSLGARLRWRADRSPVGW